jgi:hypothetical protein
MVQQRGVLLPESLPVPHRSQIVRFMVLTALDLLVPDVVARPVSLAKNFLTVTDFGGSLVFDF